MSVDETRERARQAREAGPLGESPDAHALKWTLPGTRRIWNVILVSVATTSISMVVFVLDASWVMWGLLALAALVVFAGWVLIATPDQGIEVRGALLVWKRGRQRRQFPLQQIIGVRWSSTGTSVGGDSSEKVHNVRIVLELADGEAVLDGLTATEVVGTKKALSYGELLTFADYDRLCDQIRRAAAHARELGTEQDVPDAMRQLAARRTE